VTKHAYAFTERSQMEDSLAGVEFNQRGHALSHAGDFAASEAAFATALVHKRRAHAEDSVNICITLSNRADNLLLWAKRGGDGGTGGTSARELLARARAEATHMLGIAQRLSSADQTRIAREILADVATAEAASPTPVVPRDPSLDSLVPRTSVTRLPGGGVSLVVEPPSSMCIPCGAAGAAAPLQMCGVCQRAWYCSVECQRSDWPAHKVTCKLSAGAAATRAAKAAASASPSG